MPEADAGEDVRGHVQGVRGGGGDLGVTASGGDAALRQLRLVVGVDQVVGDSGMIGFGGEEGLKNRGSGETVGEGVVMVRLGGQ